MIQSKLPDKPLFNVNDFLPPIVWAMGGYFALNTLYLILHTTVGITLFDSTIEILSKHIPVIYRPVDWLLEHENPERAELVKNIYGFNWLVFIFFFPGYLMLCGYQGWLICKKYKNFSFFPTQKMPTYQKALTKYVMGELLVLVMIGAFIRFFYFGNFQFGNLSCLTSNCVHKRNWDLFSITLIPSLSLIFIFLFFCIAIEIYLLLKDRLKNI